MAHLRYEQNYDLRYEQNYDSWEEFVEDTKGGWATYASQQRLSFAQVGSVEELEHYLAYGWEEGGREALAIAEEVIKRVETDHALVPTFEAYHSVSGGSVDVGMYLQGVPECMVEYEPVVVSNAGRVIRLVVSVGALADYSSSDLVKRGAATVALALALEACQHSCEIWLDSTIEPTRASTDLARTRVLIKHARDVVSPERLAFMLGHPAALRVLVFGARCTYPAEIKRYFDIPGSMGSSVNPVEDMEEGTIYTPALNHQNTGAKVLKPYEFVIEELGKLGLI